MLAQKENDFVLAARAVGVPRRAILSSHILPNAVSPVSIQGTLAMATAIIDVAALVFLGLGPPDPGAPVGTMLADVNRYFASGPHLAIARHRPCVLIVLGFNLMRGRPARGARSQAARPREHEDAQRAAPLPVEGHSEVEFWTSRGTVYAVNGITFDIAPGGDSRDRRRSLAAARASPSLSPPRHPLPRRRHVTGGTAMFEGN